MNRRPSVLNRALRLGVICVAFAVIAVTFLFLVPPSDSTTRSDAVFVLGLATVPRIDMARKLSDENGGIPIYVSEPHLRPWVCEQPDLICVSPNPETTKGEAKLLNELLRNERIDHPAIVTFGPQLLRARYIFDRCSEAEFDAVRVDDPLSVGDVVYQSAYQSVAFLKAIVTPCAT